MSVWIIIAIILGVLILMAFSAWGIILWWLEDFDFTTSEIWMPIIGGVVFPAGWIFWIDYFSRHEWKWKQRHEPKILWAKRGRQ